MATSFESYLSSSPNLFMRNADKWMGIAGEGVFRFGAHTASLGREISYLKGDIASAEKCHAIANDFDAARTLTSSLRLPFPIYKLVTGQMFWATEEKEKGETGPQIKGWKRDEARNYVVRDWTDIAMDLCMLFARLIAPVRSLHQSKVIDLTPKASKGLLGASMGLWGTVLSINLVQAARDLVKETKPENVKERAWSVIQGGIDFVALPFDFGLGASHPALAITGCVLNMLSAGCSIVYEMVS